MAELNAFGYRHGSSAIHRLDVRCKLACLLLLSSAVLAADLGAMIPLSLGAALLWRSLHLPLRILRAELAAFSVFLLLVFVVRAVVTPGEPWLTWGPTVVVSREGLRQGAVVAWRLAMVVVLGLVFVTTTPPSALKAAVQWLLRPLPFVPADRAATMVGLTVRFIPVLHQQIGESRNALAARAGCRRRLSFRRVRFLALPTLRRVMLAADQLSLAMAARGYQERRTGPVLCVGRRDGVAVAATGVVLLLTLLV